MPRILTRWPRAALLGRSACQHAGRPGPLAPPIRPSSAPLQSPKAPTATAKPVRPMAANRDESDDQRRVASRCPARERFPPAGSPRRPVPAVRSPAGMSRQSKRYTVTGTARSSIRSRAAGSPIGPSPRRAVGRRQRTDDRGHEPGRGAEDREATARAARSEPRRAPAYQTNAPGRECETEGKKHMRRENGTQTEEQYQRLRRLDALATSLRRYAFGLSSSAIVLLLGVRSRRSRIDTSCDRDITRRMFSPASFRRSASLHPRRASSAKSDGKVLTSSRPCDHFFDPVEVAADADVVHAGDLAHVLDVIGHIRDADHGTGIGPVPSLELAPDRRDVGTKPAAGPRSRTRRACRRIPWTPGS